jgi:hypothetical protein
MNANSNRRCQTRHDITHETIASSGARRQAKISPCSPCVFLRPRCTRKEARPSRGTAGPGFLRMASCLPRPPQRQSAPSPAKFRVSSSTRSSVSRNTGLHALPECSQEPSDCPPHHQRNHMAFRERKPCHMCASVTTEVPECHSSRKGEIVIRLAVTYQHRQTLQAFAMRGPSVDVDARAR